MSHKFDKYLPKGDNIADGGFHDDRFIIINSQDDRNFKLTPYAEQFYREEYGIPNDVNVKDVFFSAGVGSGRLRYDLDTDTYYFIVKVHGERYSSKSTIHVILESDIFYNKFDEVIEVPAKIEATRGVARIIIPTKKLSENDEYIVNIEYKDEKDFKMHKGDVKYTVKEDEYVDFGEGLQNMDEEFDFKYDNSKTIIEYGYEDAVHGLKFEKIEGIEAYQKEDGTWTSEAVENPEKYLKSDLDWYYSDERVIQYLVNKKVFTEEQANAIRTANYEDIFSVEYKIKHYGFIFLIIFFALIVAIVVRKIIKNIMMS